MKVYHYKKGDREFKFVNVLGVYWFLGTLFLTAGLGMVTENFWIVLIQSSVEIILDYKMSNFNEYLGIVCLLIGIALVFLALRSTKNDFYREIYDSLSKTMYALGTMNAHRLKEVSDDKLKKLQNETQLKYEFCLKTTEHYRLKLRENEYEIIKNLLDRVVEEVKHFGAYRKHIIEWEQDESSRSEYDPSKDREETLKEQGKIFDNYNDFIKTIRKRLRVTIEMPKIENISNENSF